MSERARQSTEFHYTRESQHITGTFLVVNDRDSPLDFTSRTPVVNSQPSVRVEDTLTIIKGITSCRWALRDSLIFYFLMPLNDLFDDIDHQMSTYRLLQPSESCRAPQP